MKVTTADNCYCVNIKTADLTWKEWVNTVKKPRQSAEKGTGAINFGECSFRIENNRYVAGSKETINKCALSYDLDDVDTKELNSIKHFFRNCRLQATLYSTFSHNPAIGKFRYRLIVPLDRTVTIDEWQTIQRAYLAIWNLKKIDESCLRPSQWMYEPVIPIIDGNPGNYDYEIFEGMPVPVNDTLEMIAENPWKFENFKLPSEIKKEEERIKLEKNRSNNKSTQMFDDLDIYETGDPRGKNNIVGAFCRVVSIPEAIEEFDLPYEQMSEDLFKYTDSTSGIPGAHTKADGTLFFSHHETDPAFGKSDLNAFDLVRLHKYGLEYETYMSMVNFARSIPEVAAEEKKYRNKLYFRS